MAATTPSPETPKPRNSAEQIPSELVAQYLDALLKGHVFGEAQKKDVNFSLLQAVASEDPAIREKAIQVLDNLNVFERWRLGRLLDVLPDPTRAHIRQKFADFMVGMLPDDFADTTLREYSPSQRLFSSGDDAEEAFLVEDGTILISKNGRKIAAYGKNEFFGNLPFLIPVKRTADAFALTPVKVKVLSRTAYQAKFATYSSRRQRDEFQLAYGMIRQLIAGLARFDSSQKVLVDYLFPEQTRFEQEETLGKWIDHFTSAERFGGERIFALFNILEIIERELPFLLHLETADKNALASLAASGKGILRGLGVSQLKTALTPLQVLDNPPVFHRLDGNFKAPGKIAPQSLEMFFLADFLWPEVGGRKATLTPADIESLKLLLKPDALIYFAGTAANRRKLKLGGLRATELTSGLYAFTIATGPLSPEELAEPAESSGDTILGRITDFWRKKR